MQRFASSAILWLRQLLRFLTAVALVVSLAGGASAEPADGTSHGGGGGENANLPQNIRKAFIDLYTFYNSDGSHSLANSPSINHLQYYIPELDEHPDRLPRDPVLREALQNIFREDLNTRYFFSREDFDRAAGQQPERRLVLVTTEDTCAIGPHSHLATNVRLNARIDLWKMCYSIEDIRRQAPNDAFATILPLHFHELVEIVHGASAHPLARRVQEAIKILHKYRLLIVTTEELLGHLRDVQIDPVVGETRLPRAGEEAGYARRKELTVVSRSAQIATMLRQLNTLAPLKSLTERDYRLILSNISSARFDAYCRSKNDSGTYELLDSDLLDFLSATVAVEEIGWTLENLAQSEQMGLAGRELISRQSHRCVFRGFVSVPKDKYARLAELTRAVQNMVFKMMQNDYNLIDSRIALDED